MNYKKGLEYLSKVRYLTCHYTILLYCLLQGWNIEINLLNIRLFLSKYRQNTILLEFTLTSSIKESCDGIAPCFKSFLTLFHI